MRWFKAIAAMSENRVIGSDNRLPWHLPEDFKWFKEITLGHVVVLGRLTFESIGQPLPGRTTVVLSRSARNIPGVIVISSLAELEGLDESRQVFICGGEQIYKQLLSRCSELYLTLVKRVVEGDRFFPPFEDAFRTVEVILDRPEFRITRYARTGTDDALPGAAL